MAPASPFQDKIPLVVRLQLQRTGLATVNLPLGGALAPAALAWVPLSDSSVSFGGFGDVCPFRESVGLSCAGPRVCTATGLQLPCAGSIAV